MDLENTVGINDNDDYSIALKCPVIIEFLDFHGSVARKIISKQATIRLVRNEFKDIILQILSENGILNYTVREMTLHKRFICEGKASVHLCDHNVKILISNCAPSKLTVFLKTLYCKMRVQKQTQTNISYKSRLLSNIPRKLTEISPLTACDINASHSVTGRVSCPESTPVSCKKRKVEEQSLGSLEKRTSAKAFPKIILHSLLNLDLTEEQRCVVNWVLGGKSLFFTGSAGTGKSFLLKKIVKVLPPDVTFITASTGMSAMQMGGTTLHAFGGIGLGSLSLEHSLEKLSSNKATVQRWKKCHHLIVDEISMVPGDYFSKLEKIARIVKKNNRPFGGIQLILCGDFLQLPPVTKENEPRIFCFQTSAWERCINCSMELNIVHRQTDETFISILNSIRLGRCTKEIVDQLMATRNNNLERDGIQATVLCTHNEDVDTINEEKIQSLEGKQRLFEANDSISSLSRVMNKHCPVDSKLILKVGTQVMLLKNLDVTNGLVNGARGVVVRFEDGQKGIPVVRFACGITMAVKYIRWNVRVPGQETLIRYQLPLKLAWAISVHKAQGMTLDCVQMSLGRVFECGQAYVALSRARSLQGLRVLDFNKHSVRAHPDVVEFYNRMKIASENVY